MFATGPLIVKGRQGKTKEKRAHANRQAGFRHASLILKQVDSQRKLGIGYSSVELRFSGYEADRYIDGLTVAIPKCAVCAISNVHLHGNFKMVRLGVDTDSPRTSFASRTRFHPVFESCSFYLEGGALCCGLEAGGSSCRPASPVLQPTGTS
ncbi:hypothetical protein BS17DRAFT_103849 [Gyrodon lividus]|nr:hypothetical protein BS17DRAFT_103849 [Gyrodon lividus]